MSQEQTHHKKIARAKLLVTFACFIGGLLAGGNVYRYLIEVPAWRYLNMADWGTYSRHADLGNGIFLFSFEAITSTLLLCIASVLVLRNHELFRPTNIWLHVSTLFALAGIALTFFAAPYMLNVRTMTDNPELLQQVFEHFHFWGMLRAIAQVLSFFSSVMAIRKIEALTT
jgi:hypothetical protein